MQVGWAQAEHAGLYIQPMGEVSVEQLVDLKCVRTVVGGWAHAAACSPLDMSVSMLQSAAGWVS
jgi:hypothetical protein